MIKSNIRKKILDLRKKNKKILKVDLDSIIKILVNEKIRGKKIGGYYPVNFEIDDLKLLEDLCEKNFNISLPVIKKNNQMDFYKWSKTEPLIINKFGIPEPVAKKIIYPDILLVPLVAYDLKLNRLGYGGGFYDRYIDKISKIKNIFTIGLAYSFQKIPKVPINSFDKKLNCIVTEKEILI